MIALPYITIVIFLFFQEYAGNVRQLGKRPVKYCNYFILIVFFCFRGYVFTDVLSYQPYFYRVATLNEIIGTRYLQHQWWEPGFVVYMSFFKTICGNYFFYQFFDSLIDLVILYKCLEYFEINNSFSIMVFLVMNGMIMFFDLQRNIKSILIFCYSLRYVQNEDCKKYYLFNLLSYFFHHSSIVYFICYPMLKMKITKRKFVYISFTSVCLAAISSKILSLLVSLLSGLSLGRVAEMANAYITSTALSGFLSLGVLEKFLMMSLIILNFDKLFSNRKNSLTLNCFALYIIFYFSFFGIRVLSERLSILFVFSYWILVPKIIEVQKKEYKLIFSFFVLTYCILKMSLYSQPQDWYENWLFGEVSSLEERRRIYSNYAQNR